MFGNPRPHPRTATLAGFVAFGVLLVICGVVNADDRVLQREARDPYVFIVVDSSSSMAATPPCTQDSALNDMDPFDAMCTSECELGSSKCQEVCPDLGCKEYDLDAIVDPGVEIIQDNGSAVLTGAWDSEVTEPSFQGTDYLTDQDAATCEDLDHTDCKSAAYTPVIPAAGDFQVYVWWPEDTDLDADGIGDSFASNTLVDVQHTGGTSTVDMDQRLNGGQWNIVGTYNLDTSLDSGKVTIRNENGSGLVVADGVRWLEIDIPGCIGSMVYRCQQPICPLGDCPAPLNGDDPTSKLYQAKEALYEVIREVPFAQLGFDTYEQDNPRVQVKHWTYRVSDVDDLGAAQVPPQLRTTDFLQIGDLEVFGNYSLAGDATPELGVGDGYECNTLFVPMGGPVPGSPGDHRIGCDDDFPADLTDLWEVERARRVPKLGREADVSTAVYYRVDHDDDEIFRVTYSPLLVDPSSFGDSRLVVDVTICRWDPVGGACHGLPMETTQPVYYDLISDFVADDGPITRQPMQGGGYFDNQANLAANDTCQGLDPNDDTLDASDTTADDTHEGYNIRWPTIVQDATNPLLDLGDFVPFDPDDSNRTTVLRRLAPNIAPGGLAKNPADFRAALYFNDDVAAGDDPTDDSLRKLRLKSDTLTATDERPFIAAGKTPLGESLADFEEYYFGPTASPSDGFSDWASVNDELWECRQKYVLLLTDGTESCYLRECVDETAFPVFCIKFSNNPEVVAADLLAGDMAITESDVQTYVVGFGLPTADGNQLDLIAAAGGTTEAFLPDNKEDLISDLTDIFGAIDPSPQVFASASVPAVQAESADKIYLSSFSQLDDEGFWPGQVDAFRKPLPLDGNNQPDTSIKCVEVDDSLDDLQAECHIWDAGERLCQQAPDEIDIETNDFKLGSLLTSQRRVFYGQAYTDLADDASPIATPTRPNPLRLFNVPTPGIDPDADADNPALDFDTEDLIAGLFPDRFVNYLESPPSIGPSDLDDDFRDVLGDTLVLKDLTGLPNTERMSIRGCDVDDDGLADEFVLGDVFHASPLTLGSPSNFTYFANNTFNYRDFAIKHAWRREMLAVASNDGQLHFFDAGIRQVVDNTFTSDPDDTIELYNDGSGYELFSYIPRLALPVLTEQVGGNQHVFSIDNGAALGDVYIDPDEEDGVLDPSEREWRTVLIGGLREGGDIDKEIDGENDAAWFKSGYYALDLTQPDILNSRDDNTTDPTSIPCPTSSPTCDEDETVPTEYLPSCLDFDYLGNSSQELVIACESKFPSELWIFTDSVRLLESEVPDEDDGDLINEPIHLYTHNDVDVIGMHLDEDGDGIPDLADTWSRPVVGQILVCDPDGTGGTDCDPDGDNGDLGAVQVAIFGGGFDPLNKLDPMTGGNYLYMINVETGEAIYKQELCERDSSGVCIPDSGGAAVGDPAVLDTNSDGYFNRIYIATTKGKIFKVDLDVETSGNLPGFSSVSIDEDDLLGQAEDGTFEEFTTLYPAVTISKSFDRVTDAAWAPFEIYDTGGSPFFFAPVPFFIPNRGLYGLAVGTGDREDLWASENGEIVDPPVGGRFIVFVDEEQPYDATLYDPLLTPDCDTQLPIVKDCLETFAFDDAPDFNANYLEAPETDAMGNQLRPGWVMTLGSDIRVAARAFLLVGVLIFSDFDSSINADCEQVGTTRTFVLLVTNAAPIAPLSLDDTIATAADYESHVLDETDRFESEEGFTTAPFVDSTATKNPSEGTAPDDKQKALAAAVREALLDLYPRGSRFNEAFMEEIKLQNTDTGFKTVVSVPVSLYQADWKDQ